MTYFLRRASFLLLLAAVLAPMCTAQSFVFASPNTRTHMSEEAALASQDSFEQRNFLAVAEYLAGKLCHNSEVRGGEGLDQADTENTAITLGCKGGPAIYLGELLARYAHQEWVLFFSASPRGHERLFVIHFSAGLAEAMSQVRQHQVPQATVIAEGKSVRVYIWVKDHAQDELIRALAQDTHAETKEISGTGLLIGNDDRKKAQQVFDKKILAYEREHKTAFSLQLWSKHLHDMEAAALLR